MPGENFEDMRKRVIRDYKYWIVRSALRGHKAKGRGLVLLRCNKAGMVHLSYLTLDMLRHLHTDGSKSRDSGAMLIEKIAAYSPDSEIAVMVSDGESERLSFGVRQAT